MHTGSSSGFTIYKSEYLAFALIAMTLIVTFTIIDNAVPFVDVFDNPILQVGLLLGAAITALSLIIYSTTTAYFGHGFGLTQHEIDQLYKKMKKSGYSAYTTITLTDKLKFNDELTRQELTFLTFKNVVIFDSEGNCLSPIVPLSDLGNEEKPQRPKLRLIDGGKE